MRILILGINFHPELIGIGKYTGELAADLIKCGHQVHVITAPPYYPYWLVQPGYKGWQYRQEKWPGILVERCPKWVPRKPSGSKRIIHLLSFAISSFPILFLQCFWKPDLLLCIAPSILNAPLALFTARLSGAKAWIHIQDFELDAAFQLKILLGGKWLQGLMARLEQRLLNGFDMVSSISPRMVARLHAKGVNEDKTCLFPNWADISFIRPMPKNNKYRQNLNISPEQVVFMYSGNLGQKQGLELVIEAADLARADPCIQFVICGEGNSREQLIHLAEEKNLQNIHFLPVQPLESLPELLASADVHLVLEKQAAADLVMPSKLTNILAAGRPSITTAIDGTALYDVIITNNLGLVSPPNNIEAFVKTVKYLAENETARATFGSAARSYAEKILSKELILSEFEDRMSSLVSIT